VSGGAFDYVWNVNWMEFFDDNPFPDFIDMLRHCKDHEDATMRMCGTTLLCEFIDGIHEELRNEGSFHSLMISLSDLMKAIEWEASGDTGVDRVHEAYKQWCKENSERRDKYGSI
jgi:hypothetical protein